MTSDQPHTLRVRAPQLTPRQQAAANIANQVIADAIVEQAKARTRATLQRYHWHHRPARSGHVTIPSHVFRRP